jgi:hypothetical protein
MKPRGEQLGPKTRHVLNYQFIPISAVNVLTMIRRRGLDPIKDDAWVARDLKARVQQVTRVSFAHCEKLVHAGGKAEARKTKRVDATVSGK